MGSSATTRPRTPTSPRSSASGPWTRTSAGRSTPAPSRRVDGLSGNFGWTQGIDYFSNTGKSRYNAFQAKLTRRFSDGYSLLAHYTLPEGQEQRRRLLLHRPQRELRPGRLHPHPRVRARGQRRAAVRQGPQVGQRRHGARAGHHRRLAGQHQRHDPERAALQRELPGPRRRPRHRAGPPGPDRRSRTSGSGDGITSPYFNVTPIGTAGSAFGRPATGTFGNLPRNELTRPRVVERGRVALQALPHRRSTNLEFRHRGRRTSSTTSTSTTRTANIGVPGNNNANAGFITGMAPNALTRNLQFALRLQF